MPLAIRLRNPTAPAESYIASSQPIYENTYIPYQDFAKDCQEELHPADVVATFEEQEPVEEYAREVPYYAEDEAFPDATAYEEPATLLDMPDMLHEVQVYYPAHAVTRWVPPPPPVHAAVRSFSPMQFWYRRLLVHPLYMSCSRLVGYECPAPVNGTEDHDWACECGQWWESLSQVIQDREIAQVTPARSWNPYNLRNNIRFHEVRTESSWPACNGVVVNPAAARFPVPPPPSHDAFHAQHAHTMGTAACDTMFLEALVRWWRMASEWTAATAEKRPWVCPPPTTENTPAGWSFVLYRWWDVTLHEMKMEDEKKARSNGNARAACVTSSPAVSPVSKGMSFGPLSGTSSVTTFSLNPTTATAVRSLDGKELW